MNDKIEFDLVVNGEKAKKSLEEIEKELGELEKKDKTTTSSMKANWVAVGSAMVVAAAALGKATSQALTLEKATFGLNKETKDYIRNASEIYGLSQEMVAGFIQTGKYSGMAGDEIANMIEQAVAIKRMYPHESIESIIDGYSEMARTGRAAGFMMDVLTSANRRTGVKLSENAVTALTLAEKLELLKDITAGVNKEFDKTAASKVDQTMQKINNTFTDIGDSVKRLANESGLLWLFRKAVEGINLAFSRLSIQAMAINLTIKKIFNKDSVELAKKYKDAVKDFDKAWEKFINGADADKLNKGLEITIDKIDKSSSKVPEWLTGMSNAFYKYGKTMGDAGELVDDFAKRVETSTSKMLIGLENQMTDMIVKGKADWREFSNMIIAEIVRIQVSQRLIKPLAGGLDTMLEGFFHTGGEVKHTGGIIGTFHNGTGMMPDERLIKAQAGEAIINRAGANNNKEAIKAMNAGYKVGGGGNVTTAEISFNVQAIDAASFNQYLVSQRSTIENIISSSIASNGSVRKTINQSIR